MADASSVTTFVMGDRLPWPEDPAAPEDKGPYDAAALHHNGARIGCAIRKISALGATIGGELAPALGDRVAVEFANGQRAAGRVAWTDRRALGVRFDDNLDVIALLNRKLVSQTPERRTMPRVEVRCGIHIKSGERLFAATLRNVSARGMQVEGADLPDYGTFVSVFVEGLVVPAGEVVWKRGNLAGIELFDELNWTSIIPWVRSQVRRGN